MFICDAHCDTLYKRVTETNAAPDVTLERLQEAGVTLQTLALFSGPDPLFDRAVQLNAAMRHEFLRLKEEEGWIQITDLKELKEGQVAFLLSLEGCQVLTPGLSCVDEFYEIGVRMMSLTWNHENALATSHNVNQHDGLKAFGLDVVKHCQQLGIMIDVSHLKDVYKRQGLWYAANQYVEAEREAGNEIVLEKVTVGVDGRILSEAP